LVTFSTSNVLQPPGDAGQCEDFLLFQREDKAVQLLKEQLARLSRRVMIRANRRGLARLLANPLPDLPAVCLIGEDDQVLEVILGNELVELDSNGVFRNGVGNQNNDAALFGNGLKVSSRDRRFVSRLVAKLSQPSSSMNSLRKSNALSHCLARSRLIAISLSFYKPK
jgi:hypothetical protein